MYGKSHNITKRKLISSIAIVLTFSTITTGCSVPDKIASILPHEEESTEPRYVKDADYAKKMDEYVSLADATVETPFGNVAIKKTPDKMRDYDADHLNKSKLLKETKYLAEYTDNKANTDPAYIVHFSYAEDVGNIQSLCESFVMQTADIPQSILFDNGNTLHGIYNAKEIECDVQIPYLDETTEKVRKFVITENDSIAKKSAQNKHFSNVYVFQYNGGYIFCECYAYADRNVDTAFYDVTQSTLNGINEKNWKKAFKESLAKTKEEEFGNEDKPTVEDCDNKITELFGQMILAQKETAEQKKTRTQTNEKYLSNAVRYIPNYKPENKLLIPEMNYLKLNLKRDNYNVKRLKKKESKGSITRYYEWQSKNYAETKAWLIKPTKKYYKKYYKNLVLELKADEKNYTFYEKRGQNFQVAYGVNKKDNKMWAVYMFNKKILHFTGTIPDVVKNMNMIRFSYDEYKYKDYKGK